MEALAAEVGGGAASVDWRDESVDWSSFDAALLRATWDYTDDLSAFLAWVERTATATRLWNPPAVVRWNTDKRYLGNLSADGVPIVPTTFVAPGTAPPSTSGPCVVKPSIGAGSRLARRCAPDEVAPHVDLIHAGGGTALVQPYVDAIDDRGETSLCFFAAPDGLQLSHAFGKAAILSDGEPDFGNDPVAKERVAPRDPESSEVAVAEAALGAPCVRRLGALAYARVDVVHMPSGPVVMELELVEPSFYFRVAPGSVERAASSFRRLIST